jgi:predicted enzyme related to lactoylglutathione lyase
MEPFDVMEHGRMAVFQDPLGAFFSVWQAKKHHGFDAYGAPGFVCWNELMTTDTKKAKEFYTRLVDWKADEQDFGPMKYTMFKVGDKSVGGMMKITEDMGPVPPNWLVYFAVEDCDASVQEATRLGGRALVQPSDIPNVGRFSVLTDPQGAAFAIIRLTM